MAQYMIELPHKDEECLQALDEISEHASALLPKVNWGCKAGVHIGWAIVDAENEIEARNLIGSSLMQEKARVVKLNKFTEQDIESFHKM